MILYDVAFFSDESLKSDSQLPKKYCFICFNESLLKMMKNIFYIILKALFILKILKFLSWLLGHLKKSCLIRKIRWISKFMTSHNTHIYLQYTYCPISHEEKPTRQWNLASEKNITREIFFFKNQKLTQGRLFYNSFCFSKRLNLR